MRNAFPGEGEPSSTPGSVRLTGMVDAHAEADVSPG